MRQLKLQGGYENATSAKGQKRVEEILYAARDILIDEGFQGLTMRKIARRCDMSVGNVAYYFEGKEQLLQELLRAIITGYMRDFEPILEDPDKTAEEQFTEIVSFIIRDLRTKETTRFFPELWARANHDPEAQRGLEYVYTWERGILQQLVARVNPSLSESDQKRIALFMSAAMEGHTMFVGFEKPFIGDVDGQAELAAKAFLHLVKTTGS